MRPVSKFLKMTIGRPSQFWLGLALTAVTALPAAAALPDYASVTKLGGDTTFISDDPTVTAYKNPAANLGDADVERHRRGDVFFEHLAHAWWIPRGVQSPIVVFGAERVEQHSTSRQ